jgi:AAA15 family ATPase/GTPase
MPKPTQIKSISVENVRGISSRKHVFETPDMLGNKFHLLVAPNGYGKSSLAAAFDSLKPRSLKIHPSLLHKDDEANKPKLEISYMEDGVEKILKADDICNEISKVFSISVINSKLKPRAVAKTGFNQLAKPTASLIIEPIILADKVPNRPGNNFAASELSKRSPVRIYP